MKDLWIVENNNWTARDLPRYAIFEEEEEAKSYLESGDSLYKIPSYHQEYIGTAKMGLIK